LTYNVTDDVTNDDVKCWDSSVADCRGEWAMRLLHAPPHGKPAPLLVDEARSARDFLY
jgi:hypothetical protein